MLQVVERATIGNRRNHGAQLQRGHGDAFAEGAHLADAAEFLRNHFVGITAQLLARDVVPGEFAEPVFVSVVGDLLKTELASERFEVSVVGVRQRGGQIHAAAATESDRRFFRNHAFAQRGQGDGKFDGRAGLRAARQRQLLVDHGQHASAGRLDRDDRAVHVAQRVNGGLAYDRIFAGRDVTGSNIVGDERTHAETLVIATAARGCRDAGDARTAAARQTMKAAPRALALADLLGFRFRFRGVLMCAAQLTPASGRQARRPRIRRRRLVPLNILLNSLPGIYLLRCTHGASGR